MINSKLISAIIASQTYKDNGNVDSLIDENIQEINYLNKGIVAIIEAIKATNSTIIALEKSFGFLNSAFVDIQVLRSQIEKCEEEKKLAEAELKIRSELSMYLDTLDSQLNICQIVL